MKGAKIYEFPGAHCAARAVVGPVSERKPVVKAKAARPLMRGVARALLLLLVICSRPISVMFNVLIAVYFVKAIFQHGAPMYFSVAVCVASLLGSVAVKYLALSWTSSVKKNSGR